MLKSWQIGHFKSILNSGDLALAGVTVLVGLNNSGKSSLLQSLLMVAQTLDSKLEDRPLLPNGPIVQLGRVKDVLSDLEPVNTLEISFELALDQEKERTIPDLDELLSQQMSFVRSIKVTVNYSIVHDDYHLKLPPANYPPVRVDSVSLAVESLVVTLLSPNMRKESFSFRADCVSEEQIKHFLQGVSRFYYPWIPRREGQLYYLGKFIIDGQEMPREYLVDLSHFLPTHLIQKFEEEERLQQRLPALIASLLETEYKIDFFQIADVLDIMQPLSSSLQRGIKAILESEQIATAFPTEALRDFIFWFKSLPLSKERRGAAGRRLARVITTEILDQHSTTEGLEPVPGNRYVEQLERAVRMITRFFTGQIRYLGPLRAEPFTAQHFAPSSELDDVGPRGEYAAAVYYAQRETEIEWFNPFERRRERGMLADALNRWVRYLGVASSIGSETAGREGFSWQITYREGQRPLPLSAVGVGASQVLPILVMGLLAPPDTLLLIEQPELHLHPAAQARLGDFFVGLAECGKQCLVETHSENLVTQLRYHIVRSGGHEPDKCMIYFVSQNEDGATQFEPINISPHGNILNWPEGFFDETNLQEEQIAIEYARRARLVAQSNRRNQQNTERHFVEKQRGENEQDA